MALTKGRIAAPQITASGTGDALDISASYRTSLYVRHSNGSGTVTVAASITVQVKASGGTFTTLSVVGASTTTGGTNHWVIPLPDDAVSVQLIYVAPTGASGMTLDYEAGTITAL